MRVHARPRYLLTESLAHFERFGFRHPIIAIVILLLLYGSVLEVLHWIYGEFEPDMLWFALLISALLLLVGSAVYTYTHVPGYHFGG